MKNVNELRKELSDIHQKFLEGEKTLESVKEEITAYESFIKDFFSKQGCGLNISKIYTNDEISTLRTESADLYKAHEVYEEYIGGMMNFINEIVSVNVVSESEDNGSLQEKFNRAKENDSQFIESLSVKYSEKGDHLLSEACSNISFLIDFVSNMGVLLNYCENTDSKVDGRGDQLSKDSLSMLFESVSHYCNFMINEAVNTYDSIYTSLNKEPEKSPEEFKLF